MLWPSVLLFVLLCIVVSFVVQIISLYLFQVSFDCGLRPLWFGVCPRFGLDFICSPFSDISLFFLISSSCPVLSWQCYRLFQCLLFICRLLFLDCIVGRCRFHLIISTLYWITGTPNDVIAVLSIQLCLPLILQKYSFFSFNVRFKNCFNLFHFKQCFLRKCSVKLK